MSLVDPTYKFTTAVCLCLGLLVAASASAEDSDGSPQLTAEQTEFFEAKIRPILVQHCYECHSTDAEDIEGGLVLDSKWGWQTGGDSGPAIIPGNLAESHLIDAVRYEENIVSAMPPKSKLPPQTIKLLERWVEMGAPDPRPKVEPQDGSTVETFDLQQRFAEHWSWRPIEDSAPPAVQDSSWPRSDLDRFILHRLETAGLRPAAPADKATLLRRVYFDLIGLPPTAQQIDAFVADPSADAYEQVVQQLLDSPHFGEKWARHWMDLVRYAETYGHEFDYPIPQPTEYRDYLIRAFNADVPYDDFVVEHIAGDLLAEPRLHPTEKFNESVIGTGFWYFHEATHAPTDVLQNEADIIDNQLDVFGKAFLGLTVACARCHDHKFDAISTADYYALSAFIQSSCRQRYPLDPGHQIEIAHRRMSDLLTKSITKFADSADALTKQVRPDLYYQAAADLIRRANDPALRGEPQRVFDGFESDYSLWSVTGDAFGKRPATKSIGPQREVVGKSGRGFVSSYAGSDRKTGELISQPFEITHDFIQVHVGGGKKQVGIELRVDDQVVHTAHGENREDLITFNWDVKQHIGKQGTLRIFDQNQGGWGHVNVDEIVFTNQPTTGGQQLPTPSAALVAETAKQENLNAETLSQWIRVLTSADPSRFPPTPADVLALRMTNPAGLSKLADRMLASKSKRSEYDRHSIQFAKFDQSLPDGWTTTGSAFRATSDSPLLSPGGDYLPPLHTIDSRVYGPRATGALRSPTFTISEPNIHVRMRAGANISINVIIDNYQMAPYNGLLFRGTFLNGGGSDTKGQWQWKTLGGDLKKYIGHKAYLEFIDDGDASIAIKEIVFSDSGAPPPTPDPLSIELADEQNSLAELWAATGSDLRRSKSSELLHWLRSNQLIRDDDIGASQWAAEMREIAAGLPLPRYVLAMAAGTRENAKVYVRGSPTNLGEEVPPRILAALGGQPCSRLELAQRIASPDNPLTARAIVNRLWHHLFGRGIVASVDDFGPQGQPPSHPRLLDHLASEFIAGGWSIKEVIRAMVLSQTYRQSSVAAEDLDPQLIATADPANVLLHRMRVRRLPAESIRDAILSVSGRLNPKQFGGSVATYRTPFMTGRGARGSGPLDGDGRRTIYLSVYRNFLNPFLLTFDMPNPFGPKGRRSDSNVPAQALTLMNDPFVVQQAAVWADKLLADDRQRDERIRHAVKLAHGITPDQQTVDRLSEFLQQQIAAGADERQAWSDLAHALFNMKSFYFLK
jgi:hypothetical protein